MAKASNVWKLIVLSVVISLVVLAVFTAVFITMIVPAYNITRDQVYAVLSRALPILIGLILLEIGLLIGKKSDAETKDTIDKLTPNSYDSWLYSKPADDPLSRGEINSDASFGMKNNQTEVKEVIKEVPVEVVKEVPVEIIKEVEKPIEIKVPVEVIKEVQVPVEVIKEVPVEVVREVVKEVPVEVVREVVKEVPVEVVKEVIKEVPVEVVKEVPVEVEKPVYTPEEKVYNFREALDEELSEGAKENYPVTLVGFGNIDQLNAKIERALGSNTLYFTEDGITYAILPFYETEDAERATRLFMNKRIVTQKGKKVSVSSMISQASKGLA